MYVRRQWRPRIVHNCKKGYIWPINHFKDFSSAYVDLGKYSLTTINVDHIYPLIMLLQGSLGGSSKLIIYEHKEPIRKKLEAHDRNKQGKCSNFW